jgi:hypothetical protein
MILWAWTALLSAFVLYPVLAEQNPTYLPFGMVAILVVLFTVLHPSVRRARRANGNGNGNGHANATAEDAVTANGSPADGAATPGAPTPAVTTATQDPLS